MPQEKKRMFFSYGFGMSFELTNNKAKKIDCVKKTKKNSIKFVAYSNKVKPEIEKVYKAWSALTSRFEGEVLHLNHKEGKRSLIFEYFFHVLREAKVDFTPDYPERELIIVSDLMQFSKRFSFYNHCKTNLEILSWKRISRLLLVNKIKLTL